MAYNYTTTLRASPSPVGFHISEFIRPQIAPRSCDGYPAQITAEKGKPYICRDFIAFKSIHCQCATTKARKLYYAYRRAWRGMRYGWKDRVENSESISGHNKHRNTTRIETERVFFEFKPKLIDLHSFFPPGSNIKCHNCYREGKWMALSRVLSLILAEKAHGRHFIIKWGSF